MADFLGAFYVLVVALATLLPFLALVWLAFRLVHAVERSARAQERTASQLATLIVLLEREGSVRTLRSAELQP